MENSKEYKTGDQIFGGEVVDKMGFTGFDLVRSDCAKVTAEITTAIFEMLLKENKSKEEIMKYVDEEKKKIRRLEYKYSDIAFPKTLVNDFEKYKVKSFHVKAAEWSNKFLKTNFKEGSKVKIIYGYIEGLSTCDAFAFDDEKILIGKKIHINWEKQMKILVNNKINRIYAALGWALKEKQKGLESWV